MDALTAALSLAGHPLLASRATITLEMMKVPFTITLLRGADLPAVPVPRGTAPLLSAARRARRLAAPEGWSRRLQAVRPSLEAPGPASPRFLRGATRDAGFVDRSAHRATRSRTVNGVTVRPPSFS